MIAFVFTDDDVDVLWVRRANYDTLYSDLVLSRCRGALLTKKDLMMWWVDGSRAVDVF
jgi:hypothetical protein